MKYLSKLLPTMLIIVSAVSVINIITMYWLPFMLPIGFFSAIRLTVVALIEKQYYLILVSLLICTLLLSSAFSIHRQHILLPVLSLVYLVYDFIVVLSLLMNGLVDGYWKTYVIYSIVLIVLIILLFIYLKGVFLKNRTGDGFA